LTCARPANLGETISGTLRCIVHAALFDGPDLEWAPTTTIRCLWLVPITPEEFDYKVEYGIEALEERFEAADADLLDVKRRSVV
jgi:hypothetical protein